MSDWDSKWLSALRTPSVHLNGHKPDVHCYRPLDRESVKVGRLHIPNYAQRMLDSVPQWALPETTDQTRARLQSYLSRNRTVLGTYVFEDTVVSEKDTDADRNPNDLHLTESTRDDLRFVAERDDASKEVVTRFTSGLHIAFTVAGNAGPAVVFVHGVPTNRKQWWEVQQTVARFARTLSFDLLGMGESSKPLDYPDEMWDWQYDLFYWKTVIDYFFPNERVMLIADDWGSGPNSHFAAELGKSDLYAFVQLDPIAFDGYPVSEIQAFGRLHRFNQMLREAENELAEAVEASVLQFDDSPNNARLARFVWRTQLDGGRLKQAFLDSLGQYASKAAAATTKFLQTNQAYRLQVGAADQTMVQIFKTMVHNPDSVYNQYTLRRLKETYADTDYERLAERDGEDATSLTLRLNYHHIRVLAARSARLAPRLLYPYDVKKNPYGVRYSEITVPTMIMWGEFDNMMPPNQLYRFKLVLGNAEMVHLHKIPNAGHFAATDQPEEVAEQIINFLVELVGYGESSRARRRTGLPIAGSASGPASVGDRLPDLPHILPRPNPNSGSEGVADVFIGLTGLWKGDEPALLESARNIYLKQAATQYCQDTKIVVTRAKKEDVVLAFF